MPRTSKDSKFLYLYLNKIFIPLSVKKLQTFGGFFCPRAPTLVLKSQILFWDSISINLEWVMLKRSISKSS